MASSNTNHVNKVRKSMELFTLGVAILTAASFFFAKIGIWVPLSIASQGFVMGLFMLAVLVVGGCCVALAALYVLLVAYGELLTAPWKKGAFALTVVVVICMVMGVIVEANHIALKTTAEIKEVREKLPGN